MDAYRMYKATGCMASCERYTYEVSWSRLAYLPQDTEKLQFRLYFTNGLFEEKEQYLIYDWDSFIADVGGFLGLLLGWSMYSLYEDMATMVGKMKNKIMPKTNKNQKFRMT